MPLEESEPAGAICLPCTCQMARTCSLVGRMTLELFWEAPEHFPPILRGIL